MITELSFRQIETIERNGLDKEIIRKRGSSKNFNGWIIQKIKESRKLNNFETAIFLQEIYKKYNEFQKSEKIKLESWRGKSGISLIEQPDKFICVTYKKPDKGEEPVEIKKEVLKSDLNNLIIILNKIEIKEKIPTSLIAEEYYKIDWKKVFSDRIKHTYLVYMLNILEKKGKIKYSRKGLTTIIKNLDYFR